MSAGQETSGVGGSGPDLVGQATTPPIDRPCAGPVRSKPIYAGHPLHSSTSGSSIQPRRIQKWVIPNVYRIWEWGRNKPGMERSAETEMGPQMLTVSGGKPCPTNLGNWMVRFDAADEGRHCGSVQADPWSFFKAKSMSQADPQLKCLQSGSTRHLDQDSRPKYLLQFPGRFSPPTGPGLGQSGPNPLRVLMLTLWAELLTPSTCGP